MSVYDLKNLGAELRQNPYPGHSIVVGKSEDGTCAVVAYFIMGRSANSRNRVFVERDGAVLTEPFDPAKVEDPSLIIYTAVQPHGDRLIVTNGDQTTTIDNFLSQGKSFEEALATRAFEPDGPHFTPRISAMLQFAGGDFSYKMSILKSGDAEGSFCNRFTFDYGGENPGTGHFLHTYGGDGSPLPTFTGEPERVDMKLFVPDIDRATADLWDCLNADNRISLYVRYTNLKTQESVSRILNRNK